MHLNLVYTPCPTTSVQNFNASKVLKINLIYYTPSYINLPAFVNVYNKSEKISPLLSIYNNYIK